MRGVRRLNWQKGVLSQDPVDPSQGGGEVCRKWAQKNFPFSSPVGAQLAQLSKQNRGPLAAERWHLQPLVLT